MSHGSPHGFQPDGNQPHSPEEPPHEQQPGSVVSSDLPTMADVSALAGRIVREGESLVWQDITGLVPQVGHRIEVLAWRAVENDRPDQERRQALAAAAALARKLAELFDAYSGAALGRPPELPEADRG